MPRLCSDVPGRHEPRRPIAAGRIAAGIYERGWWNSQAPGNSCLVRSGPKTLTGSAASPPGAGAPAFTDEQVEAARTLYIAKCTGCHQFYPPANYSAADWDVWMRKMSRKARLNSEQDALLPAYLELFRR